LNDNPVDKNPAMAVSLALLVSSAAAIYLRLIRPWQLRWGATDQEVARPMQGDEVVKLPTFNATRAVTIQSKPQHIFPWIVQMGVTRAGWYSIDLLDNLGRPSAEVILPAFQHSQRGDLIPMSPDGKSGTYVKDFVPNQWMLWEDKEGDSTWVWGLYPIDETHTRLITRVRVKYHWLSPTIIFGLLVEFTDIVMMRKCLLGIKRRAERLATESMMMPPSRLEHGVND
jgi:hypothetical protein